MEQIGRVAADRVCERFRRRHQIIGLRLAEQRSFKPLRRF
jgi:hypothetical protein